MDQEVGMTGGICIIGLGNLFRGDDAAGILAVRRLRSLIDKEWKRVECHEAESGGPELLDMMKYADTVILIDAARSGRKVGTIHELNVSNDSIRLTIFPHSTHALNLVETIELGRVLGRLPPHVIIYGVEVGVVPTTREVSPEVSHAVEKVVEAIIQQLETVCHA